jgi:hypothetical protein
MKGVTRWRGALGGEVNGQRVFDCRQWRWHHFCDGQPQGTSKRSGGLVTGLHHCAETQRASNRLQRALMCFAMVLEGRWRSIGEF